MVHQFNLLLRIIIHIKLLFLILKDLDTVMATYERIDTQQRESLKQLEEKVVMCLRMLFVNSSSIFFNS